MIDQQLTSKYNHLIKIFNDMGRVVVAYSGGIDSTLLIKVGTDQLKENCFAAIAVSPSLSKNELNEAQEVAQRIHTNLIEVQTDELNNSLYQQNDRNRCFYCKTELFEKLRSLANEKNVNYILDGNNVDDIQDYRPGREAAINLDVRSPLIEANFSKEDIRTLAKHLELPNWDKPAQPCLASRLAYGVPVQEKILNQIDQAEAFLKNEGFKIVRVRYLGDKVSVEVGKNETKRLSDILLEKRIYKAFNKIGLTNVEIDREGYSSGKLNVISNQAL